MARTNVAAVKAILETNLTDPQVSAFIQTANTWVDSRLADEGLGSSLLTEIEKYLAAGFATSRDPLLRSAQLDDVSESYLRDDNPYFEIAARLDSTGKVDTGLLGAKRVSFRVGAGYDSDLDLPSST